MTKEEITRTAHAMRKKYNESNPEKLCQMLDIQYEYMSMGTGSECLKGFISRNSRCYCIIINSDLPEQFQRIIMFHEIGHYALKHLGKTICAFHDYGIYNTIADTENEANMFVAEYLLDNHETINTLMEQDSFFITASILNVPAEILDYKWRMLCYYGYMKGQSPITVQSDCLKKIKCGNSDCANDIP